MKRLWQLILLVAWMPVGAVAWQVHATGGLIISPAAIELQNLKARLLPSGNFVLAFFNVGVEAPNKAAQTDNSEKPQVYYGIGFLNIMQVQWGTNFRLRSDFVVGGANPPFFSTFEKPWGPLRQGLIVSLVMDRLSDAQWNLQARAGVYF